jgi:TRAP-type C4-dicarboxylate transport system permease small subunit
MLRGGGDGAGMNVHSDEGIRRPTLVDHCGNLLTRVCLAVAASALLCIVAINGANVIARYLFGSPFSWAEELMLFLMILSVFSGAIAVTWRNLHIRIDTFIDLAPFAVRQAALVIGALVSTGAIVIIVAASARLVMALYEIDQRSDALELPSWIPQSFLTVGLAVIALLIAVRTILTLVRSAAPASPGDAR